MDEKDEDYNYASILTSIKKLLGVHPSNTHFDPEIIMDINAVFLDLSQLGVNSDEDFFINDKSTLWNEYYKEGKLLNAIVLYTYLSVKLVFDPPTSSSAIESINRRINKLESRINYEVDKPQNNLEVKPYE